MSLSRMPAIFRHSTEEYLFLNSSGIFLVASPIISIARTHARFRVSFLANSSAETADIAFRKNSASSLMCRSKLATEVDILDLAQNCRADVRAQSFLRYQINLSMKDFFKRLADLKQIIVSLRFRPKSH